MEGVASVETSLKSRLVDWIRRHPGILPLILATALGLIAVPPLFAALERRDVLVTLAGERVSLVSLARLGLILVLGVVILWARSSIGRDLAEGVRRLLSDAQASAAPSRPDARTALDTPSLGVAIVRGLFDLVLLLILQSMLRPPLVAVVAAYAPTAWVDGGFVGVVVLVVLLMLLGLHRASRPLTEHLVWVGLDRLVPTAGYAPSGLPAIAQQRRPTPAPPPSRPAAPEPAEPTQVSGAPPTLAAEATVAAAAAVAANSAEAALPEPTPARAAAPEVATSGDSSEATTLRLREVAPGPVPTGAAQASQGHAPSCVEATLAEDGAPSSAETTLAAPLEASAPEPIALPTAPLQVEPVAPSTVAPEASTSLADVEGPATPSEPATSPEATLVEVEAPEAPAAAEPPPVGATFISEEPAEVAAAESTLSEVEASPEQPPPSRPPSTPAQEQPRSPVRWSSLRFGASSAPQTGPPKPEAPARASPDEPRPAQPPSTPRSTTTRWSERTFVPRPAPDLTQAKPAPEAERPVASEAEDSERTVVSDEESAPKAKPKTSPAREPSVEDGQFTPADAEKPGGR